MIEVRCPECKKPGREYISTKWSACLSLVLFNCENENCTWFYIYGLEENFDNVQSAPEWLKENPVYSKSGVILIPDFVDEQVIQRG